MTLTKIKSLILLTSSFIFIYSCETLNEMAGLSKNQIDEFLYEDTPELVLPPDFGKDPKPTISSRKNSNQQTFQPNYQQSQPYQTVSPRVTNYFSPKINIESSSSPSDSLERFKQNKRFTIGEWVYSQYVDGFKRGNIYYRPVYDKGYNFSRRYLPNKNVASFQNPPITPNVESYLPLNDQVIQPSTSPTEYKSLDQLPILD